MFKGRNHLHQREYESSPRVFPCHSPKVWWDSWPRPSCESESDKRCRKLKNEWMHDWTKLKQINHKIRDNVLVACISYTLQYLKKKKKWFRLNIAGRQTNSFHLRAMQTFNSWAKKLLKPWIQCRSVESSLFVYPFVSWLIDSCVIEILDEMF